MLYVFCARFLLRFLCTVFLTALQTQEPHEHIETLLGGYIVVNLQKHHIGDHDAGHHGKTEDCLELLYEYQSFFVLLIRV